MLGGFRWALELLRLFVRALFSVALGLCKVRRKGEMSRAGELQLLMALDQPDDGADRAPLLEVDEPVLELVSVAILEKREVREEHSEVRQAEALGADLRHRLAHVAIVFLDVDKRNERLKVLEVLRREPGPRSFEALDLGGLERRNNRHDR
eukprot:Amastigsp_a851406_8.p3 type:complete len:151 gc:universal Amastigsp_a851406_8:791-339(-)